MQPGNKKSEYPKRDTPMVRVTGLEPVRQRHTPLKRACLPIPAHSHLLFIRGFMHLSRLFIISDNITFVNTFSNVLTFIDF